jgi:hypothetical protein
MKSDMRTGQDDMSTQAIHIGNIPRPWRGMKDTTMRLEGCFESRRELLLDIQQLLIEVQNTTVRQRTCISATRSQKSK